jgi:hypothetical protein
MHVDGYRVNFTDQMSGRQVIAKLNDLCLEIEQLKDYILEYELLGDKIESTYIYEDRLSIL